MKLSVIVSSLASISLQYGVNANDTYIPLRGSKENNRRVLRVQHPCTLVQIETEYEEEITETDEITYTSRDRIYNGSGGAGGSRKLHEEDFEVKCELQEEDRAVAGKYFVPVNGLERSALNNIVSGDTTLMAEGAMIMDGEMWLPAGAAIELGSNGRRRLQQASRTEGTKKVLVVRANALDSATTSLSAILSDKIFGTDGDLANLKSQYLACSHGQLDFEPFQGMTDGGAVIQNGVIDVTINMNVADASRYDVEDALEEAADKMVGNLSNQFDHIMLCLPPGSLVGANKNWVAYAYVNSWLSVYNDGFCESLSTQVHEIGHNLGLAHSGKDNASYGDKSGMMGFSYKLDNGPLQCFNPAKSYQLGWYDEKVVEIDPNDGTWVGTLIGAVDYKNNFVPQNSKVVVKIKSPDRKHFYVGYNRKKGMNSGVPLAGDRVTVVRQTDEYSASEFMANLSTFLPTHTFYNFGGTNKNLVVQFVKRGSNFDEAHVAIYYETCLYPACCNGSTCSDDVFSRPTLSPVAPPTEAPQPLPTLAPRPRPKPVASPTISQAPTSTSPTPEPTRGRLYNMLSTGKKSKPKMLLTEHFRYGLGVFTGGGNVVEQDEFQFILTAKFQMKEAGKLPYITTDLDLKGTSVVQVNFWYSVEKMESSEGFKLQYSTNDGNSWSDFRQFSFESDLDELNKWKYISAASFEVAKGTSSTKIRFLGDTYENDRNSVFYIAGVSIYGINK